jgi:uncharacterized membrane protein
VLGAFLALLSACLFGLNNATVRRGVLSGTVSQALAITVPMGVPVFFLVAALLGSLGMVARFSLRAVVLLSAAGVIHFVWGRYCNYRATKAMGAVLAGPVQQASVLIALGLAIGFLGETLTPLRLLGILFVILGPGIILFSQKSKRAKTVMPSEPEAASVMEDTRAFKPEYVEGYIFALLSATGYGLSPVLVRLGVEHVGLQAGAAGGLISYGAATLAMVLVLAWPGQLRHTLAVPAGAVKWFTISGVFVALSQVLRYMALAVAPVAVVTPVQRLSILFRIYFSALLNREYEELGGTVIVGTVVSLIGALALSVSIDTVLSLVPLPHFLVAAAHWRWP